MDFLGVHDVIDAEPILDCRGTAEGFIVRYIDDRSYVNNKGKWIVKKVERRKVVYVKEYTTGVAKVSSSKKRMLEVVRRSIGKL